PMLLAGDEFSRTQGGNNNGYAQDSEISWINWDFNDNAKALNDFVRKLVGIRNAQPLIHRDNWRDMMSVTWYNPGGGEQQAEHWLDGGATTLGIRLSRDDLKGQDGIWWELVTLFNPHDGDVDFTVPERGDGSEWTTAIDTATPDAEPRSVKGGQAITMAPRSLILLH
ncbi:MAG: hypothetical protein ACOH2M_33535, partial [Cypionkella sp.]